jgi:hypothetical protein
MKALSTSARMAGVFLPAYLISAQFAPARAASTIVQGHYAELIPNTCDNTGACIVQFSPVPAGEMLVVTSAAHIAVPLLADTAEILPAAARALLRHEPGPRREIPG